MISAFTPGAPLTMIRFAEPRFSPLKVISEVVSRCSHSRESELNLGAGCAWAASKPHAAMTNRSDFRIGQLSKKRRHRLSLHQFARLIQMVVDNRVRVYA